jgi:hypothetical protein
MKIALGAALLCTLAAAMLFQFPPAQYSFYPQCPIHQIFGILCPGCGTTQALAALLHGHLSQALHLNALTMLLMPAALAWLAFARVRKIPLTPPPAAISATLVLAALFAVLRNL